jgi:uncharacterized membrane-anchored protein YjiN (DUF445 family)
MAGTDLDAGPLPAGALVRTRRLATAVLGLMAAVFLATHLAGDTAAVRLIRAMAEAGLIGGLADWFAVEALFRHPLGLPIPHTALLPRNQARAARNVGRFFGTHFLDPATLAGRLRSVEPGRRAVEWLARPDNAALVARELTTLVGGLLRHDPSPRALARSRAWLRAQARGAGADSDAAIADGLGRLIKEGVRSTVVGEVLGLVYRAVDDNRDVAVALVQDRSRWWIASTVDRRIADLVVDGVLSLLEGLRAEHSDLRRGFETAFDRLVDTLAAEGALTRAVGDGRRHLVRTGAVDTLVLRLAAGLRDQLRERIAADPEALAAPIADLIRDLSARTVADEATRAALDARLAETAARLIGDLRPAISGYVTDVIAGWKPQELNARFEAEIGPDLQYIRINGAVLGSLIGGAIFGLDALLA